MQSFKMCWGAVVPADFRRGVIEMCVDTPGWKIDQVNDLMACLAFESGATFSPSVRNRAGSGAIGLIQFMPSTAGYLGTTPHDLAAMTAVQQLAYVKKYFGPYASRIHSLSDMYMAILLPKYVGKSDDSVLFSGGIAYRENSGLDTNKDGMVTKAEATGKVRQIQKEGFTHAVEEVWPV